MAEGDDPYVVDVTPTKALFIDMLTRDIGINRAILDLVDNCVDGARRTRGTQPDVSFAGLRVTVEVSPERIAIHDNCGGIPLDIARHYAFRFGRPSGMPTIPGGIGQFGVGMKRALFKFGRHFSVRSQTRHDRFVLEVDVDQWEQQAGWQFRLAEVEEGGDFPADLAGTQIVVTRLREPVHASFALDSAIIQLRREIQSAQQSYIASDLQISVNGESLISSAWQLLQGQGLQSAYYSNVIQQDGKADVRIRLFVGVASSNPTEAGWYVFCNGRLVLSADQTPLTGWSSLSHTETVTIPKYHNQFARFRGYVFLDSEDAGLLPWNTTKTGIDEDSAIYRLARVSMIELMRPVIDFLNDLDSEGDLAEDQRVLNRSLRQASMTLIRSMTQAGPFTRPRPAPPAGPPAVSIGFKRPIADVNTLKAALGANSAKEVGERCFDLTLQQYGD